MRTAGQPDRARSRSTRGEAELLRRRTGRWADLFSVLLGLLLVVGLATGWLIGSSVHDAVAHRGAAEAAERTAVEATVSGGVPVLSELHIAHQMHTVTWTAPDGEVRSAETVLPGVHDIGEGVRVWTGPGGELVSAPATGDDALTAAGAAGLLAVLCAGVVVAAGWWLVSRWTAVRIGRAWDLDWARVEPAWSGRRAR
ncbi:hypothetical protein WIS52_03305 [Pseudonocardia nematodicida]|uniref:Integral membrane protein n=1 Tax=Pseudonocardia nematodicida TaxID=1206997 RepID=A0ABV1K4X3_9PSEU